MDFTAYRADDETTAPPADSSSSRKRALDGNIDVGSSSVEAMATGGILKCEENYETLCSVNDNANTTKITNSSLMAGREENNNKAPSLKIGSKRKGGGQPQHRVPGVGQGGETTQVLLSKRYNGERMSGSDATAVGNNNDEKRGNNEDEGVESENNDSNDDDGTSTETERRRVDLIDSLSKDQMALLSTLIQMGDSDGIRAYLSQLGDNIIECPPPPSFPNEMATYLQSEQCKSIVVLAGAGMSVSCGIPDFRSAGVGLYDTLRPELLTATDIERMCIANDPTLALDRGLFLQNPLPMLETKRSFILGTHEKRWRATLAHRFVELLHTRLGKLTRVYTQNIDGLEYQTSLPREKVVAVHGSMGAAACEVCGRAMDFDTFTEAIRTNIKDITNEDINAPRVSTPILCSTCNEPAVKPTIVLFRGSMPQEFHTRIVEDMPHVDLLIIIGTSLTVAPANSIVYRIPPTAIRLVMNDEPVGRRLGIDYSEPAKRDVWAKGQTDESCLDLAEKLGWLDDLELIVNDLPDSSAVLLRERLASDATRRQDVGTDSIIESTVKKRKKKQHKKLILCHICNIGGHMIVCHSDKHNTGCGECYHIRCINRTVIPIGDWICMTCAQNIGEKVDVEGYEYLVHDDDETKSVILSNLL